jgi:plasmid maintenance system killer protein
MKVLAILEKDYIAPYLLERNLAKQYDKAKKYILLGHFKQVDFKLRQPKEKGIYSFRINQQFRAFCICKDDELVVFSIDNNQ